MTIKLEVDKKYYQHSERIGAVLKITGKFGKYFMAEFDKCPEINDARLYSESGEVVFPQCLVGNVFTTLVCEYKEPEYRWFNINKNQVITPFFWKTEQQCRDASKDRADLLATYRVNLNDGSIEKV